MAARSSSWFTATEHAKFACESQGLGDASHVVVVPVRGHNKDDGPGRVNTQCVEVAERW